MEGNTVQAICRHPVRSGVLFAANYGHIYRTKDAGRSWSKISPERSPVSSVRQLIVIPGTPDRLIALTRQQGVFMLPLDSEAEKHSPGADITR
jgi:photosystem II stability/assembly factor-like uncharacterized protein